MGGRGGSSNSTASTTDYKADSRAATFDRMEERGTTFWQNNNRNTQVRVENQGGRLDFFVSEGSGPNSTSSTFSIERNGSSYQVTRSEIFDGNRRLSGSEADAHATRIINSISN